MERVDLASVGRARPAACAARWGSKVGPAHGPAPTQRAASCPIQACAGLLAGPAGSISRTAGSMQTGVPLVGWHKPGTCMAQQHPRLWAPQPLQSDAPGRGNAFVAGCGLQTQQRLYSGSCVLQVSPGPPQPPHTAPGRPTAARDSSCTQCCLRGNLPGWLHLLQGLLRPESLVAGNRHHLLQGLEQCWWLQQRQLLPPQLTAAQPALCPPLQLLQRLLPAWLPRPGQTSPNCT